SHFASVDGFEIPSDLVYEELEITTSDKVVLQCYFLPAGYSRSRAQSRATVIMFHGQTFLRVSPGLEFVRLGCDVLLVSYRGYGTSSGTPSEKGLQKDAQAALDYVLAHDELSSRPIVVHGHSLGGAVAIDVASRNPGKISAVIVENTFMSIPDVARCLPILKYCTFAITQRWNSFAKIPLIPRSTPILMLSGLQDMVVPPIQMKALWDVASTRGETKVADEELSPLKDAFQSFQDGQHADTWVKNGYWSTVDQFFKSTIDVPSATIPT
ncbi:Alpha/Beta hydrolase protein, partial [Mycena floridula]